MTATAGRMTCPELRAQSAVLVRGGATVCDAVTLELRGGEFVALVGPNGAGKSSILAMLAGDLVPESGSVTLAGEQVSEMDARALARLRAVMTQGTDVTFPFSVRDVVQMGRYPWSDTPDAAGDDAAVSRAMAFVDVSHLADRTVTSLSGGERARVALARVLAQHTPVLLLDEPTAALDIRHQELVLGLLRQRVAEGCLVVVVLHDVQAAAAFADRVVLVDGGTVRAVGSPRDVLTTAELSSVYNFPVAVDHDAPGGASIVPVRRGAARPSTSGNTDPPDQGARS